MYLLSTISALPDIFSTKWHINYISSSFLLKVINSQKQYGFLAHPVLIIQHIKGRFGNNLYSQISLFI